ncbi:Mobile element protein [Klebsiella pneumoniae IS22]|nr:Mobile element protein [Klebsiella pneumoniae IS22]CDK75111.1 Mobile element protein [Klebsiella pneumoniae IS22]CDK78224.1 Mobile element protein [Klebsiella pneumoniae IS22]
MYDGVFEVLQWLLFLSAVPPVQLLTGWCVTAKARRTSALSLLSLP